VRILFEYAKGNLSFRIKKLHITNDMVLIFFIAFYNYLVAHVTSPK
jgi:hypothetical protein